MMAWRIKMRGVGFTNIQTELSRHREMQYFDPIRSERIPVAWTTLSTYSTPYIQQYPRLLYRNDSNVRSSLSSLRRLHTSDTTEE